MDELFSSQLLIAYAERAVGSASDCICLSRDLKGWGGWPAVFREEYFVSVGALGRIDSEDATLEEYHPEGTTYWSPDAPIAPAFYPYNRCTVWTCTACERLYLRHSDQGAYHCELRIRRVTPELIVDAALL